MNINIFIALNKVTVVAVNKLSLSIDLPIIFYHSKRCIRNEITASGFRVPLNIFTEFILYVALRLLKSRIILYIPHPKVGKKIENILKNGMPVCLIPDGMDYYRSIPNNIELKNKKITIDKIYLDKYHEFVPDWILKHKNLINLDLKWCPEDNIESNRFQSGDHIIIESLGVEKIFDELSGLINSTSKVYLVKHPAPGKRKALPILMNTKIIECNFENLEIILASQSGVNVYFGETFSAIMLLDTDFYEKNNVKIYLDHNKKTILKPLISTLEKTDAKLFYY